jgi:diaminopimelate dehydrogenase
MQDKIRIGIVGYGNLGRGVELAVHRNPDMKLAAVFTRRDPKQLSLINKTVKVLPIGQAGKMTSEIDVMILCGGSVGDLPQYGPWFAARFNTVDSYDNHANIPEYYDRMNRAAAKNGKTSIISIGWDPGLFSFFRMLSEAVLPQGKSHTFWGRGVSQGHSAAIRRIPGVKNGIQYTIPNKEAIEQARSGEDSEMKTEDKHVRECYVVAEEGADKESIARQIKTMPHYFAGYKTHVTFITEEELKREHSGMPHGGFVICSGRTGEKEENRQLIEFTLKLDSNPEFTASVLTAYARAAYRLNRTKCFGARTILDVPPALISLSPPEELRSKLL